jgi:hypothetical protein
MLHVPTCKYLGGLAQAEIDAFAKNIEAIAATSSDPNLRSQVAAAKERALYAWAEKMRPHYGTGQWS